VKARARGGGNCKELGRNRSAGFAALAALLFFLAGRRSRLATPPAPKPSSPPPHPPPPAPKRTALGEFFHWFTWPIRKQDQEKRKLEEAAAKAPPPKPPAAGKPKADKDEKKDGDPGGLLGIVLKVLGAVATGIGVVGAVTVVGAAIFWVRFDAIGLPATQAVSVIPKEELLVQGAQEVAIFVGVGLAAALLISLADPRGIVTRGTAVVLGLFVLIATVYVGAKSLPLALSLGLVAGAIVLALLCIAIAFNTGQRLVPLLVSVFLAALIFSSSCALLVVNDQKYAQAVAIRFGAEEGVGKGLTGIYVTVTDDTIYFAQTGVDPELPGSVDTTGLYEVHRADTTTYAVGPLEPVNRNGRADPVEERAKVLLARLNEDGENFVAPKDDEKKGDKPS
jgi:hypothetical protein